MRDETKDAWAASWGGLVGTGRSLNFIPKAVGTFRGLSLKAVSLLPLWPVSSP